MWVSVLVSDRPPELEKTKLDDHKKFSDNHTIEIITMIKSMQKNTKIFIVFILMILTITACSNYFTGSQNYKGYSHEPSPFHNYQSLNMQAANILVKNSSLNHAQKMAVDNAKNLLVNKLMQRIESIYENVGLYYHESLSKVKKDINNYINQKACLENTVVQPEGRLYVLISVDLKPVANMLKLKIPNYINKDWPVWVEFKKNDGIKSLNDYINQQFTVVVQK